MGSASASAVTNGLRLSSAPRLSSPLLPPAARMRSWWLLSPPLAPSVHAEGRRCRCSPVSCSGGSERGDDLSAAEDSGSASGLYSEIKNPLKVKSPQYFGDKENKDVAVEGFTTSIRTVALCVSAAVAFGVGVGLTSGVGKASEFFAGYILEQSLSVDNLFVFVLVFKYFKVPIQYQNQVLSYGIAGAIIFRLSLILLGAATLQRFEAVNLLLAAILLFSSFKAHFYPLHYGII
ncbi:hypothetical protein MLD38_020255 [Melastoma candidum]|uniref:Uncharacterized protein n=1 Tax=Melastoma candidum TaxID=119954 RepID=A0ACB9QE81_9MYRT|nr:hypothetical protein MLD38_020255 [Melastoma candidum]